MKRIPMILALVVCVSALGCGEDDSELYGNGNGNGAVAPNAAITSAERDFLVDVTTSGSKEVEISQLALSKTTNAQVREFARMMVTDHQQASQSLHPILTRSSVPVTADRAAIDEAREDLADLSGVEFDRAYMDMMVDDHQEAVRKVEEKANGDGDPDVRQWASRTLPTLRTHLQRAEAIQETLKKS